jgi:hypothetical protein
MRLCARASILAAALLLGGIAGAAAQPAPAALRLALVSQWVVQQHRGPGGAPGPDLLAALEGGVVDRPVFSWQRGRIQRGALLAKPIRVLVGPEAEALGGRGTFEVRAIRPPVGAAAWTTVEVVPGTGRPDDVLVLEVGGDMNSVRQVLETLAVVTPAGLKPLPLALRALVPAEGVPVLEMPFGRPVALPAGVAPRGADGMEFVVARSPIDVRVNGAVTTNGLADVSPVRTALGDWREGDRVIVRVPAAALTAGAPPLLLGWKDRVFQEGGPDLDTPRGRASLPLPLVR